MPSIFSHVAVPIAGRLGLGKGVVAPGLLALGVIASVLPDADVLLLRLGVPYGSPFGHRGVSHSLAFAFLVATAFAMFWAKRNSVGFFKPFFYLLLCAVSHPLLDACTNAGHGAALLWPFAEERFFFVFRPIEASPLSLKRFFGEPGLRVLISEFFWVWLPSLVVVLVLSVARRKKNAA